MHSHKTHQSRQKECGRYLLIVSHQLWPSQQWAIVIRDVPPTKSNDDLLTHLDWRHNLLPDWGTDRTCTYVRWKKGKEPVRFVFDVRRLLRNRTRHVLPIAMYRKNSQGVIRDSFAFRGGRSMISRSGGLKPRAVAGKPSVTRLTHNSCTGINDSGKPRAAVRKMQTTYRSH